METGITKNRIVAELSRSPHGNLNEYIPIAVQAIKQEPEFFAHLIAWDKRKGQIRDAKAALPVISISVPGFPGELFENSLAHLAMLNPRELLKAYRFALDIRKDGLRPPIHRLRRLIEAVLREDEANFPRWERKALTHHKVMKELYSLIHAKPAEKQNDILFKGARPTGSLFEAVSQLKNMSATEAAGVIMTRKIPFKVAHGALGVKAKEPDLVLALIAAMTPTEVVTNTKMLEGLGVKSNAALRGAFEQALERASKSTANVLKTTRAAENIDDDGLKAKLQGLQDRQLEKISVDGNWLVLADKSGSMSTAIETARQVAATLAKMVKGKVWLVFFDTAPHAIDVTGASLDAINKATQYIQAGGGTSIGCGLLRMLDAKEEVDGIAIVSDGGENTTPLFHDVYKRYSELFGKQIPVYLYECDGEHPALVNSMQRAGFDMQVFNLRGGKPDFYSLPNLVTTMRTNRYSLADEIMAVPLLKLSDVFKTQRAEEVVHA